MTAAGLLVMMAACNNSNEGSDPLADSTARVDGNQAPMGDTANQINSNAGSFPADTSNQNGDDSVKGTNPASRKTTPRNTGNQ